MKRGMLILAAVLAIAPLTASAAFRGGFVLAAPVFYGPAYSPFWGAYWGPGWVGPYYAYLGSGEVKLDTKVKDAQVFIDGAHAGLVKDNKTMRLRPGSYNIEIRRDGVAPFAVQVYVVAGKTIHIRPEI